MTKVIQVAFHTPVSDEKNWQLMPNWHSTPSRARVANSWPEACLLLLKRKVKLRAQLLSNGQTWKLQNPGAMDVHIKPHWRRLTAGRSVNFDI